MNRIGIDIGGTQTRVALFDGNEMVESKIFSTHSSFELTMEEIGKIVHAFRKPISGIGVCAPGPLNTKTGEILDPGNLPEWHFKNVVNALRSTTGVSNIKLNNDANLAALGEYVAGEFKGSDVIQFFTVSTGLGAGLVINGKLFEGHNGNANEIANFVVSDDDVGYGILVNGSIEASCSGTGLANQAKKVGIANNAADLFNLYAKGNDAAKKIVKRSIRRLGALIANTISFVDPEVIVFSGSVSLHNEWFIKEAFEYGQTILMNSMRNKTKWSISKLEGLGALYGAAELVK